MNLFSVALVYFSYTFHISSATPILDTNVQPLAPFSLSPGNVNLETYWAEKYRTGEGDDNLPVPVEQPINSNSKSSNPEHANSPSALPTIENNNDGNVEDAVGEVLSRHRRSPQHHHHHEQPYYPPYHGHVTSHGHGHGHYEHGHGHGHHHHQPHNPYHHG